MESGIVFQIKILRFAMLLMLTASMILTITMVQPSSALRKMYFLRKLASQSAVRYGSSFELQSRASCASYCLREYPNCKGFMFNSDTGLCTLCADLSDTEPLPTASEGDLYHSSRCDTSKGFGIYEYNGVKACVGVFEPRMPYLDAVDACQRKDPMAFLMSVKTMEELEILYGLWNMQNTWVGCDDLVQENTFVWREDGEVFDNLTAPETFLPNEPNNYNNGEDCCALTTYLAHMLNDYNCSYSQYYACEMPY